MTDGEIRDAVKSRPSASNVTEDHLRVLADVFRDLAKIANHRNCISLEKQCEAAAEEYERAADELARQTQRKQYEEEQRRIKEEQEDRLHRGIGVAIYIERLQAAARIKLDAIARELATDNPFAHIFEHTAEPSLEQPEALGGRTLDLG